MMYYIMHRTQLILDDWQHEALRTRAEREGKSISALVRHYPNLKVLECEVVETDPLLMTCHYRVRAAFHPNDPRLTSIVVKHILSKAGIRLMDSAD